MIETKYIEYVTAAGDRLDRMAYKLYGDPGNWGPILEENPTLGILRTYPAGIVLRVPVRSYVSEVPTYNLPPWKRT